MVLRKDNWFNGIKKLRPIRKFNSNSRWLLVNTEMKAKLSTSNWFEANFTWEKNGGFEKQLKTYITSWKDFIGPASDPRPDIFAAPPDIKTEENACHSKFKTNMTTVISWEIIERWVTISKMKLTFVATELKYLMHFFHCNYVDSYWSRTMFNEFMYLRQLKVHIALFLIFCENARTCIEMR